VQRNATYTPTAATASSNTRYRPRQHESSHLDCHNSQVQVSSLLLHVNQLGSSHNVVHASETFVNKSLQHRAHAYQTLCCCCCYYCYCSLPWMTGTSINPLLRAAVLTRDRADGMITLVLPFLPTEEDQTVYLITQIH
jgi:hypothetical protein